MRFSRFCLLAGAAAALLAGPSASAQVTVRGRLLDDASGAPISSARVEISANRGRWRVELLTDSTGAFAFGDVSPGPYRLRASRVGYREAGGVLRLAADSVVELELRLAVATVALAPVTVITRSRRNVSPVLEGFYARLERGQGRFVTREEIEARSPVDVTDMLRSIPNLNASSRRGGMGGSSLSRGSNGDRCTVVFFVDGMLVSRSAVASPLRGGGRQEQAIDDYVHPSEVEGIEIYRGEGDTPAEFVTRWVHCGTVVIWTRRGVMRG
jgi:Carboxypeptidase regulatory-like domain/TonB-dependent Receptor Plug Domain